MVFAAPTKLAEQHGKVSATFGIERATVPIVDGMTEMGSHWQIEDVATGAFFLDQQSYTTYVSSLTVTGLVIGTRYYVRVRVRLDDGTWTSWSPSYYFTPYGQQEAESDPPAGGSYPTNPTMLQPFEEQITYRTLIAGYAGKEQRDEAWDTPRMMFKIRYAALTRTDMETLWNFFISQKGSYGVFSFTHPISAVVYTVRFNDNSMQRTIFESLLLSTGVELVQVL